MTTAILRTAHDALLDVESFANRHLEIREDITRRIVDPLWLLNVRPPRITVPVFEAGWYETLTDFIVAARRDGIPAPVDHEGSFMWADLDFDGLVLRVLDYHTTSGKFYALEALAECPIADLDAVLAVIVESRKARS